MINNFFDLKYNQYFQKRKNNINKKLRNFSNNEYWKSYKECTDPDGKVRDLSNEVDKKIKDLSNEIKFIKKRYNKYKKKRIIDLGSGFGFFLKAFNNQWEKVGIELSDLASQNSKKWAKIFKIDLEKKIEKKIINTLGKFDVVFSYHVIEHLKKPEVFIENARQLLKDKGHFILGTPNFDSACARRFKNKYRFFKDKTHISYFSENSLFRLLEDFGFKVEYVDYPFFETDHFKKINLNKLFSTNQISPAFYGNIMTFYCTKKSKRDLKNFINYKLKTINKIFNT